MQGLVSRLSFYLEYRSGPTGLADMSLRWWWNGCCLYACNIRRILVYRIYASGGYPHAASDYIWFMIREQPHVYPSFICPTILLDTLPIWDRSLGYIYMPYVRPLLGSRNQLSIGSHLCILISSPLQACWISLTPIPASWSEPTPRESRFLSR